MILTRWARRPNGRSLSTHRGFIHGPALIRREGLRGTMPDVGKPILEDECVGVIGRMAGEANLPVVSAQGMDVVGVLAVRRAGSVADLALNVDEARAGITKLVSVRRSIGNHVTRDAARLVIPVGVEKSLVGVGVRRAAPLIVLF